MTWKHWTAVVLGLVVGGGVVVQLSRQDENDQEHRPAVQHVEPTADGDAPVGPYRTVALEVTGMT